MIISTSTFGKITKLNLCTLKDLLQKDFMTKSNVLFPSFPASTDYVRCTKLMFRCDASYQCVDMRFTRLFDRYQECYTRSVRICQWLDLGLRSALSVNEKQRVILRLLLLFHPYSQMYFTETAIIFVRLISY